MAQSHWGGRKGVPPHTHTIPYQQEERRDNPGWSPYVVHVLTDSPNLSLSLIASSQRGPTAVLNSILSSPQQKALMKAKVVSRLFLDGGETVFRSVVRVEKVIGYGGNYETGDPISREMQIWGRLSSSELWLKLSFFSWATFWLRCTWE